MLNAAQKTLPHTKNVPTAGAICKIFHATCVTSDPTKTLKSIQGYGILRIKE
jgi:hypothetical protein